MRKVLVANRGEIAVRVIRAVREAGLRSVAVYSDSDREAMHKELADESVRLGGETAAESYLDVAKVLDACRVSGADALHPGYGFLSERASFSRACRDTGVTFIGPSPEAMELLGAKIDAKRLAVSVGVPVTPGLFEPGASDDELREAAGRVGYPVMLKASAGGGGRGMRAVTGPDDFDQSLALARDEAQKAFGDPTMMLEKLVLDPRHIEVQFVADTHGQVVCLFERECSVQRRHQKLVEESPSPVMTDDLWHRMREATTALVRAAGYVGAGTAEFMFDEASGEFYFLEVNARLQVEHPVTEAVTGWDLVRAQIDVADGKRLDIGPELLAGQRTRLVGHAVEARVVAEDPANGFVPSVGRIVGLALPQGPGVRVDTGYGQGSEISRHFDSLVMKVVAHGPDRAAALARLCAALRDTHVLGVKTNVAFLLDVLEHPEFAAGRFDTGFVGREFGDWTPGPEPAWLGNLLPFAASSPSGPVPTGAVSAWDACDGFRNGPKPNA
ncbi:MAG: ATP-grasp domain-containing protein [Fimbriimonadaceae bacterium]|nr:ATP-grasp domain-containing protein [Fimbriimonadaceae bacterium]